MKTYSELILASIKNPPNRFEPQPIANRRETIFGVTLSLLVLSWFAVVFRLWVRIRIVREPGLDDVLVFIAAIFNTVATTFVCLSVEHGLGHHMLYIGLENMQKYLLYFYIENSLYLTETAIIKISLLVQFLRIFKAGAMRWTCIALLVLVTLWGLGFSIIGWFPCFPVRGTWDRAVKAKCYGFGMGNDLEEFVSMFKAHSASNMALDLAIFLTPLVLFSTPNLKAKNLIAMAGVFTFGASVVAVSVWRLYTIIAHEAATYPYVDFTWWSPQMVVLACVEVNLAIICASMPIFWPIIEQSFASILVSYEVKVTEERVDSHNWGLAYEMEYSKFGRSASIKSSSGTSVEALANDFDKDVKRTQYTVGADPLSDEVKLGAGFQATVQSKPKSKWEI